MTLDAWSTNILDLVDSGIGSRFGGLLRVGRSGVRCVDGTLSDRLGLICGGATSRSQLHSRVRIVDEELLTLQRYQ